MNADKAAEELKVIRQLMERPVRYSTQSGLAGILAGLAAIAGLALTWHFWLHYRFESAMVINFAVWVGVFVAAMSATLVLARLRERRHGIPAWSPVKRQILLTVLPPFLAGVAMTVATICRWYVGYSDDQTYLIPAIWMLFYGVALWQLGEFTNIETRVMGAAFLLAGAVAAMFFQHYPHLSLGITFGGFHIIYGVVVRIRHGG